MLPQSAEDALNGEAGFDYAAYSYASFDANTSITLQNVAKASLVADDFRFA